MEAKTSKLLVWNSAANCKILQFLRPAPLKEQIWLPVRVQGLKLDWCRKRKFTTVFCKVGWVVYVSLQRLFLKAWFCRFKFETSALQHWLCFRRRWFLGNQKSQTLNFFEVVFFLSLRPQQNLSITKNSLPVCDMDVSFVLTSASFSTHTQSYMQSFA